MTFAIERLTDRGDIADGIDCWNEHVPAFTVTDWMVERTILAPVEGVTVRCYGVRGDDGIEAFAAVKWLDEPVATFDPTERAWLSVFAFDPNAGATVGRELLETVAAETRAAGATELVFGQDPQNLLAGVPDDLPEAVVTTLEAAGFALGDPVWDLERDITGYTLPADVRETAREWPDLAVVRATDRETDLFSLLADQFPGRWHFEARTICRIPGGPADYWLLTHDGMPTGFLRTNRHDGPYRDTNVFYGDRLSFAPCGVGPLGIHADYRGRGWGLFMIASVLERLADAGYGHCVIDWTDKPGYYEQLGFERWIRYRGAIASLVE